MGWQMRAAAMTEPEKVREGYGVGLAHAYSGTMAFDVDNWGLTLEYGIDVDAMYLASDAVVIDSGREGHGKLLYRMPFGLVLPSKRVQINKVVAFELRCATADGLTVQDVLPPSIHPKTNKPYMWAGQGNWHQLPMVPSQLIDIWFELLKKKGSEPLIPVDGVDASWDEIKEALTFVEPDCSRDDWISIGMALHWTGTRVFHLDEGFAIWNEWSAKGTKYPGLKGIWGQWNSFKPDKEQAITLGSLFHIARSRGWTRKTPDASTLFSVVEAPKDPELLIQDFRPTAPNINLALWPTALTVRAQEVSDSVGCDPIVPLFAGMAAVCGVVDARMRLELMPGFEVPPVLWLMTIGDPADKKSPGSWPMLEPLASIEYEDRSRFSKAALDWEAKQAAHGVAKKAFIDFASTPEAMLGVEGPHIPDLPEQPVPLKITVSDVTSQKLVRQSADRPRGLLCHLDEMNSWARKIIDKTSGEDRSAWVMSYEAKRYEMDRVGAGSIHAENLAVSIYGNIQPRVFREAMDALAADGLLQRFIPAVLRHDKTRLGQPIPAFMDHSVQWENTLRFIFSLPAMTYKLSSDAYTVFRGFQGWYERRKQDERLVQSSDAFMTAFGKLEGLTGRLILLFHILESPFAPIVDEKTVKRVIRIIIGYVIPSFKHTLSEIGGATSFESWLTDHLIQYCDKDSMTMRDIKRSGRRQWNGANSIQQSNQILSAMVEFERAGWVARTDDGKREHAGIAEWLINPKLKALFKRYRAQVVEAKQRLAEGAYSPDSISFSKARGIEDMLDWFDKED